MECDRYIENGQDISTPQAWACGVKRKFGDGGMRVGGPGGRSAGPGRVLAPGALLEGGAMLAGGVSASPRRRPEPRPCPRAPLPRVVSDSPFMNNMDEITYWIVTKRAPCLAGYNNPLRRVQPQCSRAPLHSASPEDQGEPEKKKKKLVVLHDDSDILDQTNVHVEAPPQPVCEVISDESETLVSDVDFNIKKTSVQMKNKKTKTQKKSSHAALHKKNKVVTSTPKVTSNLRRSLRKVQSSVNNNSHLNSTLDIFDTSNGNDHPTVSKCQTGKFEENTKLINMSHRELNVNTCAVSVPRPNNGVINGQFDDLSDVSGFTANYIKSTKINSKTPGKVRSKQSRNLAKESRHSGHKEERSLIVSINKATGDPKTNIMNCSTDSSQNIINLVTVDKKSRTKKLDKSTSLLKFMESKKGQKLVNTNSESRNGVLNTSFQSTSTTGSRYPKRHKNNSSDVLMVEISEKTEPKLSSDKRTATNQSSRLESTELVSRTRSGRSRHSKLTEPTVYVRSDFPEQESTVATVNVANAVPDEAKDSSKTKRSSSKYGVARRSLNKTGQSNKDSFREKSGFAACFSDSDDDKPLKPQKYLS
ncbi:uncharacterized protein LOC133534511 [Cydia pomonella]|uniref:uncharacterized protein LOC133534511 n=1 Tax=Cydia pomonella TaxID=82600 RepID=UPI002ADD92C9|nr:uncharacterized protein LOC133534511 [Cydia pomonella]